MSDGSPSSDSVVALRCRILSCGQPGRQGSLTCSHDLETVVGWFALLTPSTRKGLVWMALQIFSHDRHRRLVEIADDLRMRNPLTRCPVSLVKPYKYLHIILNVSTANDSRPLTRTIIGGVIGTKDGFESTGIFTQKDCSCDDCGSVAQGRSESRLKGWRGGRGASQHIHSTGATFHGSTRLTWASSGTSLRRWKRKKE